MDEQDELNKRRNQNKEVEACAADTAHKEMAQDALGDFLHATTAQRGIQEFGEWCQENMPTEKFKGGAIVMTSSTLGAIIGAWFGAGASPELVKEFLARFTDLVWEQCKE